MLRRIPGVASLCFNYAELDMQARNYSKETHRTEQQLDSYNPLLELLLRPGISKFKGVF